MNNLKITRVNDILEVNDGEGTKYVISKNPNLDCNLGREYVGGFDLNTPLESSIVGYDGTTDMETLVNLIEYMAGDFEVTPEINSVLEDFINND